MNFPISDDLNSAQPNKTRNWIAVLSGVISTSTAFIALAAKEWLPSLIDQPTTPPFIYRASFKDEFQRISRLIVFVIILSGLILGSLNLIFENLAALALVKLALKVLVLGFIVAICYQPFAYLVGVRIAASPKRPKSALTLRQILFSVLYTFVPWIPVFTFLWATLPTIRGSLLIFAILVEWICSCYAIYNFAKAVLVITKSSKGRVWASILLPMFLVLAYVLFR